MAKDTLDANEFFVIRKNRSGENGFHEEEMRQFIYNAINQIGSLQQTNTPQQQIFASGVFSVINIFDTIAIQTSQIVPNTGTDTITVLHDGTYKFSGGLSLSFPSAESLGISWFVNGIALAPDPVQLAGEGNGNDITVSWESIRELLDGDVVDIRAENVNAGNLTASFKAAYSTVRRIG